MTPNSDTPYSFLFLDLRAEPVVLCVPEIAKDRYYSVMLTSQYTFNFGYIGSRATGNGAGCYAVAGPGWKGAAPAGVKESSPLPKRNSRSRPTPPNCSMRPTSTMSRRSRPSMRPSLYQPSSASRRPDSRRLSIDWPKIDAKTVSKQEDILNYLPFLLQFAPPIGPAAVEVPLRQKFARIGVEAGKQFPTVKLTDADKAALAEAAKAAASAIKAKIETMGKLVNGWTVVNSGIGDRALYDGDWTQRAAVAVAGILANDPAEAVYPIARKDENGQPLDGSKHNYTLTLPPRMRSRRSMPSGR